MGAEGHQHEQDRTRPGNPETAVALDELKGEIRDEQAKIKEKAENRGKRFFDEYKEHDDVLVEQVNVFVDRLGDTDAISPAAKVVMLQKVLRALNDYVGGVDGAFSDKDRVADRLSGILKDFNRNITTAEVRPREPVTNVHTGAPVEGVRENIDPALSEIVADIKGEQGKIKDKLHSRGNAYGAKYREHEIVIMEDVNYFIKRVNRVPVSTMDNSLKVGMLNEILRTLNDYVGGLDGFFSGQHRVAERLSGILQRFNGDITAAEREARPDPRLRPVPPPRRERVPVARELYEVKDGDTMLDIVASRLGVDWHQKPRLALALVKAINDTRGPGADPNMIYANRDVLDIGKARKELPNLHPDNSIFDWYAGYGHPSWVKALRDIAKDKTE
ncbi:MAG: hypothetical protein WCT46_03110 [Candidatus Gracilibacteria bacterium]